MSKVDCISTVVELDRPGQGVVILLCFAQCVPTMSQLKSEGSQRWQKEFYIDIPDIIAVVFDLKASSHPTHFLLLGILLTVQQWSHSLVVQTIWLKYSIKELLCTLYS